MPVTRGWQAEIDLRQSPADVEQLRRDFRAVLARKAAAAAAAAKPAEDSLTDESIVEFEGESVRWGSLMMQDRHAYLNGGYAF